MSPHRQSARADPEVSNNPQERRTRDRELPLKALIPSTAMETSTMVEKARAFERVMGKSMNEPRPARRARCRDRCADGAPLSDRGQPPR